VTAPDVIRTNYGSGIALKGSRRAVVGHSGGVTSAWSLGWALNFFDRDEVVALFHDTQREDSDTYRFLHEIAGVLGIEVTERSDGRSVEEVEIDEGALANNRMAFCSRILKAEPRDRYFAELRAAGVTEIINIVGFSAWEPLRIQRAVMRARVGGYTVRFPVAETWPASRPPSGIRGKSLRRWIDAERSKSKQFCADWCMSLGVRPPRMYKWSDHANCINCRRGGKAYIIESGRHNPNEFIQLCAHERNPVFQGHTIFKDGPLEEIVARGLKRKVSRKESIEIGACECGT
jgi:Phosphoadenosine phosphosulfate reductase family